MSASVELHEYIRFIKEEVKKSEDPKPKEGLWIGAQSLSITFQTTTEIDERGGLKMFILSTEGEKKERAAQSVTINLVTQEIEPKKPRTLAGRDF